MILAANMSDGLGMVVLVLAGTTMMLMMLRRHQFRRVTGRDVAREQLARLRDQKEVRNSMDELLLQLEQLQRNVNAQLDTKFARLEQVIADADDRIRTLQQLQGGQPVPVQPSAAEAYAEDLQRPLAREGSGPSQEPLTEEHRRVYAMHDAGSTPLEVAEALGLPLGEVEVILQLRRF